MRLVSGPCASFFIQLWDDGMGNMDQQNQSRANRIIMWHKAPRAACGVAPNDSSDL